MYIGLGSYISGLNESNDVKLIQCGHGGCLHIDWYSKKETLKCKVCGCPIDRVVKTKKKSSNLFDEISPSKRPIATITSKDIYFGLSMRMRKYGWLTIDIGEPVGNEGMSLWPSHLVWNDTDMWHEPNAEHFKWTLSAGKLLGRHRHPIWNKKDAKMLIEYFDNMNEYCWDRECIDWEDYFSPHNRYLVMILLKNLGYIYIPTHSHLFSKEKSLDDILK